MKTNNVIERFDSITEFVGVIGKRQPNTVFSGRELSSETGTSDFTLTESYDESISLLMNGYKEGLNKLTASTGSRISRTSKVHKNLPTTGVVGYTPHIPNAITGVPQSMITSKPVEQKAKVVTILYNIVDCGSTDANRFITAGRNLLEVIMRLELNGYRVGLKVIMSFCSRSNEQNAFCIVQIKHHRQPSNPLKIAYPLLHPSYFRRQGFRWLETCPGVTNNQFSGGYGRVFRALDGCSKIEDRRDYLRKHNMLEAGCFYTEFEEAEENSAERLIEVMGIKKK